MNQSLTYFYEVLVELKKVTWPKREDLIGSAIIVIIFVLCFAVILGAMDSVFSLLAKKLIGTGGIL